MSWQRKKTVIKISPAEPSLLLWLMAGLIALITGFVLFVLHANQLLSFLQQFNIWLLSFFPLTLYIVALCFRGALFHAAFTRYKFDLDEAEHAQKQWSKWAGRYLAVLHSVVVLPDLITASQLIRPPPGLERRGQQTRQVSWNEQESLPLFLSNVSDVLLTLPANIPLRVTFLTDSLLDTASLQKMFNECWVNVMPIGHSAPEIAIRKKLSFLEVDERIQSPEISAELILVHQLQGADNYSDALVVLLLTTDDVARKYDLKYESRFLRPMDFDKSRLSEDLTLFFSTQTQANTTQFIAGDAQSWSDDFSELLKAGEAYGGHWKTDQLGWLEALSGISGPYAPWVMAALCSDVVRLIKADCLMLSSDGKQSFINTVTTGNKGNGDK